MPEKGPVATTATPQRPPDLTEELGPGRDTYTHNSSVGTVYRLAGTFTSSSPYPGEN